MRRLPIVAALLVGLALAGSARAEDPKTYPYDVSARTLPTERLELGAFWVKLGKSVLPGLQLTTHAVAWPALVPNLYAKWTFVETPAFAAALDGGVLWAAIATVAAKDTGFVQIPLALRATASLAPDLDFNVAWRFEAQLGALSGLRTGSNSFRSELSLVRTDGWGAWLLQGTLPIFAQSALGADSLLGKSNVLGIATVDTLPSWSVTLARDFSFPVTAFAANDDLHVRVGAGYRYRPGMFLIESIGNVAIVFDVYLRTRWGPAEMQRGPAAK